MYQKKTIRRAPDAETRAMMRAANQIELGLRQLKRTIDDRQAVGKWLKERRDADAEVAELFEDPPEFPVYVDAQGNEHGEY